MLKKMGFSFLMLFIVLTGFVHAADSVLKSSLASSTHSKSTWSNTNKITVSWTKPSADATYGNVKGYAIKWDTSTSTNPGTSLSLDANATSTTSGALADGQSIYFHIRVVYENGAPFEWDDFGPFWIDATAPSKPSSFSITAGDAKLTLSWTNPGESDFAGVVIRSSTKSGDTCSYPSSATTGTAVATVTTDTSPNNSYVNTSLTNDTTYCYSIFAYDQRSGESARNYSSAAQANSTPKSTSTGTTYPTVISNDPNTNATDVAVTTTVSIGFSKDMTSNTIADSSGNSSTISIKDASSNSAKGVYTYTASTKTVKFTPSSSLSYSTKYTVTVLGGTSGVKDSQGNQFDGNGDGTAGSTDSYSFNFTTVAQTPPDVSSITPADTSTNIALSQKIVVTFTKSMGSNSIKSDTFKVTSGSATGTAVSGTYEYNDLDKTATFTPSANYTGGAKIYITIVGGASGIKDSSGLELKNSSYSYSFTVVDTPILEASATSINFGAAVANSGTKDQVLTVTNKGKTSLTMGASSVSSTTHFSVKTDGCNGQSLAQDASCNITVTFAPTATGTQTTNLLIPSNSGRTDTATSTTTTVALSGSGDNQAALTLSKTNLDFGTVSLDASSGVTVTITSSGTLALQIGAFTLTKGNVGFSVPDGTNTCKNQSIAVNSTCTFVVVFTPTAEGASITDVLSIASNNGRTDTTTSSASTVSLGGSAQKSSFNISLISGWNLISLPYQPATTAIATVLTSISGKYTIVWAYVNGQWKVYDPSDVEGSTITAMEAGLGYWIKTTQAQTLPAAGTTPSASSNLISGWNLVGFGKTTDTSVSSTLNSISGKYTIVWAYVNGQWKVYDPSDVEGSTITNFLPGYGYWIKMTQASTWTLP